MVILGMVANLVGVLTFLVIAKNLIDHRLESGNFSRDLNFYFLLVWGVVAAIVGGVLWAIAQRVCPSLMFVGVDSTQAGEAFQTLRWATEPHGIAAIVWAVVTNLPMVILLIIIARRFSLISVRDAVIVSLCMLFAVSIGSLLFYDIPLYGYDGFRSLISSMNLGYWEREIYIALLWSGLLSILAFGLVYIVSRLGMIPSLPVSFRHYAMTVGLLVGVTICAVGFFTSGYPYYVIESGREIVGGVSLRVSLFFGIIAMLKA